jgi:hypothetical protein
MNQRLQSYTFPCTGGQETGAIPNIICMLWRHKDVHYFLVLRALPVMKQRLYVRGLSVMAVKGKNQQQCCFEGFLFLLFLAA